MALVIADSGCMGNGISQPSGSANSVIHVGDYPSFDAALAACASGIPCTLLVPQGAFATKHFGTGCISQSSISIVGSGQPAYDDISAPKKLQGGTIIQPGLAFCGASNIYVSDLGIDDGPAYVAGGGEVTDGLVFDGMNDSVPEDPIWTNNAAERVTSLGSSNVALAHAFRFEHGNGFVFDGLKATYDTHCLAVKSQNVKGGRIDAQACSSDQVIIKSDNYTAVSHVDITQINVGSLVPNDSQNGVVIDSEATTGANNTSSIHVGNIQATGIYSALTFLANGNLNGDAVTNVAIDGLQVNATFLGGPVPDCVLSTSSTGQTFRSITISNVQCVNGTGSGGFTATRLYTPMFESQINNWTTVGLLNPGTLNGSLQINGWQNSGPGAAIPTFYLIGGPSTVIEISGYEDTVPGGSLYYTDGQGETMQIVPSTMLSGKGASGQARN